MKIKPTNDLLFKKMMTTTGKEYILEDFIEAVTGMKLTNVRPTNPYQIESYQKEIENLKQKNDALQNAINSALDPEKIYTIATEELGMVYPGDNQVIEYKKSESEYVRQYENIPKS